MGQDLQPTRKLGPETPTARKGILPIPIASGQGSRSSDDVLTSLSTGTIYSWAGLMTHTDWGIIYGYCLQPLFVMEEKKTHTMGTNVCILSPNIYRYSTYGGVMSQ